MKKLIGVPLYLILGFPLLLAGLSLFSVKSWITDRNAFKAIVEDKRFAAVLEAPQLPGAVTTDIRIGSAVFSGPEFVAAAQKTVPAKIAVDIAKGGIDSLFDALEKAGNNAETVEAFLDLADLKKTISSGAATFADVYVDAQAKATTAPATTADTPETLPVAANERDYRVGAKGFVPAKERAEIRAIAQETAKVLPEKLSTGKIDMSGSRNALPVSFNSARTAVDFASLWILIAGSGITVAAAFIGNGSWRKRLGSLGTMIIVPGAIILATGLAPYLLDARAAFNAIPDAQARAVLTGQSFPALADFGRFLMTRLSSGFLWTGVVAVGIGTLFATGKRLIEQGSDEEEDRG